MWVRRRWCWRLKEERGKGRSGRIDNEEEKKVKAKTMMLMMTLKLI